MAENENTPQPEVHIVQDQARAWDEHNKGEEQLAERRALYRLAPDLYKNPDLPRNPSRTELQVRQIQKSREDRERGEAREEARQREADEILQKYSEEKEREREGEQAKGEDQPRESIELEIPIEVPREHFEEVESYVGEMAPLASELGVPQQDVQTLVDYAVSLGVGDRSGVDLEDPAACINVVLQRYGKDEGTKIIADAQRAVSRLGPKAAEFLDRTMLGSSPAVLAALAAWERGDFRLSPERAQQELDKLIKGDARSAYRDASHSGHRAAVDRANLLYKLTSRKPKAAESRSAAKPETKSTSTLKRESLERELKAAISDPNYLKSGPGHAAAVSRAEGLYRALYGDEEVGNE